MAFNGAGGLVITAGTALLTLMSAPVIGAIVKNRLLRHPAHGEVEDRRSVGARFRAWPGTACSVFSEEHPVNNSRTARACLRWRVHVTGQFQAVGPLACTCGSRPVAFVSVQADR